MEGSGNRAFVFRGIMGAMNTNGNGHVPPIVYPTIKIREIEYILKVGLNARYRFENYGLADFATAIQELQASGKNQQMIWKVFASICGTQTRSGLWKPINLPDITMDELPETLAAELADRFVEVSELVTEAFRKVLPPDLQTAQPADQTTGPKPNESEKTDTSKSGPSEPALTASV